MDQAIAYLGGLRLLDGQVLYQDFALPHGPVSVWVFALLLKITPTGGWAVVLGSGLLNLMVSSLIGRILLKVLASKIYAAAGALLTAIWFTPVYGWIYIDHLAFAFVLASAAPLCMGLRSKTHLACSALAGVFAFHTKITIAIPGLLALILSLILAGGKRAAFDRRFFTWLAMLLVFFAASVIFIRLQYPWQNYLVANYSNPIDYWFHADSPKRILNLIYNCVLPFGINPVRMMTELGSGRILFYPIIIMIYAAYLVPFRTQLNRDAKFALYTLIFTTIFCGAMIGRNHTHLFFGCGGIAAFVLWSEKRIHKSVKLLLVIWIGMAGMIISEHESTFFPSKQSRTFNHSDLYPVRIQAASENSFNLRVFELAKQSTAKWALLTDRQGFLPLMAARIAPINYELLHHDGLTIPSDERGREYWQTQTISKLNRYQDLLIITDQTVENGFRSVKDDGSDSGRPVPMIQGYLDTNFAKIFSDSHGTIWERHVTR